MEDQPLKLMNVQFVPISEQRAKMYLLRHPDMPFNELHTIPEFRKNEETGEIWVDLLPDSPLTIRRLPLITHTKLLSDRRFYAGYLVGDTLRLYELSEYIDLESPVISGTQYSKLFFPFGGRPYRHVFGETDPNWTDLEYRPPTSFLAASLRLEMKGLSSKSDSPPTVEVEIPAELRDAIVRRISLFLKRVRWCTIKEIENDLKEQKIPDFAITEGFSDSLPSVAHVPDAFPAQFQVILDEMTVNVHGAYFATHSTRHEYDEFRRSVLTFFAERPLGTVGEDHEIVVHAVHQLGRRVVGDEFTKVMNEICTCVSATKGSWVLGHGP